MGKSDCVVLRCTYTYYAGGRQSRPTLVQLRISYLYLNSSNVIFLLLRYLSVNSKHYP
jgi:hypothetical protein